MRLAQNLRRKTLALRSGVSESSVKRFELTGDISLDSLIRISNVLSLNDWVACILQSEHLESLESMMKSNRKIKKRGVI